MIEAGAYGFRKTVPLSYDAALAKVREALQEQGFGVLSEIDIREKLQEKLGVDFKRYTILGACNPPLAYKALQAENDIGLLLPCNVIVYENGENESVIAAIDPDSMVAITHNEALATIAADARERLKRALASM
jgi:uncharacterized protein (DUF302 family)